MEDDADMRYERLQSLLNKSKLYSKYILGRIEAREEDKAKKLEMKKKREMRKQEEEVANKSGASTPEKDDVKGRVSLRSKNDSGIRRKLTLKAPVPKSQLSSPKADQKMSQTGYEPKKASDETEKPRRGTKRKATIDLTLLAAKADGNVSKPQKKRAKKENEDPVIKEDLKSSVQLPEQSQRDSDGRVVKPILLTGGDLRPYQIDGLNWLTTLYENCVNGILADEMGLGKTIQCIATIAELINQGCEGPFLIVAPLSTLPNWNSEFKKFTPNIPVIFYHGTKEDRGDIRGNISKLHCITDKLKTKPVVLTSYELAINDRPFLHHIRWRYLIVDEGHRLKNMDCRLVKELKMYNCTNRLLLTGTPLQNNLSELWSLLNFLLPRLFDDLGSFESWFDVEAMEREETDAAIIQEEQKKNILGMFHQILSPFMLRRVKTDVDLKIPPKKEIMVLAELTDQQKDFYESIVDKTITARFAEQEQEIESVELTATGRPKRYAAMKCSEINLSEMMEDGNEDELIKWCNLVASRIKPKEHVQKSRNSAIGCMSLRNVMMMLRRVCNHPYLIEYPLTETEHYRVDEDIVNTCGKFKMLDRMLKELKKRGHKVLIFSQMTKMLDIIGDYMHYRGYNFCRLDGSTSVEGRKIAIESFNTESDMFAFLLSTRAGGLGINLTSADTVIIYDSDWNPQNDLQAQDRCHRIGQTRPVMVYRLVTANTIDQKIVQRAAAKRKLEKMVIKKGHFKNGITGPKSDLKPLTPEELLDLLKSRDHCRTVGMKDKDFVMSKSEMDALLDRSDMIEEFEKTKLGKSDTSQEKCEDQLRTSGKDSFKLFETLDYDSGNYEQQEATAEDNCDSDQENRLDQ